MIIENRTIARTPSILLTTEKKLLELTSGSNILWLGRAATALIIAYKAIALLKKNIAEPEVILPSISCSTPSNTALLCGMKPRYADVDLNTGLITLDTIKKRITDKTVAIVFIHLYGNTANLNEIRDWCNQQNIYLIEDNAQSLGGILGDGSACGSLGDFSIYSFNTTKIIETGGGALLIKTEEHCEAVKWVCENNLPEEDFAAEKKLLLSKSYRNLHHSLVDLSRINADAKYDDFFLTLYTNYAPLYIKYSFDESKLATGFSSLEKTVADRLLKARIYKNALAQNNKIKLLDGWENSNCCWRFSFLFLDDKKLITFSESIRKEGFHVSNLYWRVNQFFNENDVCPNGDYFARKIVNLWVDASVDEEYVKKCASVINKKLHELEQ